MSVTVWGSKSIYLGCAAALLGEDGAGERAMAWAEPHIVRNPALRYIVGRYVEADNPNENGHLFPLETLKSAQQSISHSPLNMVHRPHHVVGHFMATEMLIPDAAASAAGEHAEVEALSAFYAYYFKEELVAVQSAHNSGQLFYSMECIPQEGITCPVEGCGTSAPYTGLQSPLYCEHMNAPGGAMKLNNPHFVGGALIVPPTKPGWRRADITNLSSLIEQYENEAAMAYEQVKAETPHLGPEQWEYVMSMLLGLAKDETLEQARELGASDEAIERVRVASG